MKRLSTLVLVCVLIQSCSSDDIPEPDIQETMTYKVNGVPISIENNGSADDYIFMSKQAPTATALTRYVLSGQKGGAISLSGIIVIDSLVPGNYSYDSAFNINYAGSTLHVATYNGLYAMLNYDGDYFEYTISSHANSRVSGTFSGKLSPVFGGGGNGYETRGTTLITEGRFTNIPVSY